MAITKQLNLKFDNRGMVMRISPALIISGEDKILVDVGIPGVVPLLEEALSTEGVGLGDLTHVIITHHDHDHFGALAEIIRLYPQIKVVASEIEVPYLEGKEKSLRLVQAESIYDTLPEERKEWARQFHDYLSRIEPVSVDVKVKDGDVIDSAGEVVIVATPGHMPGHISVYVKGDKTLVAGDALIVEGEQLKIANPQYSLDIEGTVKSAEKMLSFEIDRIICYHGGAYIGHVKEALSAII